MGSGRNIVLTMYGHENLIDKIAISVFDSDSDSRTYCETINALKTGRNPWVYTKAIPENTPLNFDLFIPNKYVFSDLILSMDDRAIQKVLREVEFQNLVIAMKGTDEAVLDKILQNMSKRGGAMLKEDMEYIGPVRLKDVEEKRDKIVDIIRRLEYYGEIIITRSNKDVSK